MPLLTGSQSIAAGSAPKITRITPNSGPVGGGTIIIIKGNHFTIGNTDVTIGGNPATNVSVNDTNNPNIITATTPAAPAGKAGARDVVVTTPYGKATLSGGFAYVYAPTVTDISPKSGPINGHTTVTITGQYFTNATAVQFGSASIKPSHLSNSDTIFAVSPSLSQTGSNSNTVDITVTTPGGTSTISNADLFTYVSAPTVSDISPASGPAAGDTSVTITGTNLSGAAAVQFGTTPATITFSNSDTIFAVSPPETNTGSNNNTVNITVTTPGGSDTFRNCFTYVDAPTITSIFPISGPVLGNTDLTINGTNFTIGATVTIGGNPATNVSVSNNTKNITATTPAGNAVACNVVVTNPDGQSATLSGGFTYFLAPTVSGILPTSGPAAGGTSVNITGTNLTGVTGVNFGSNDAASFTVNSDTKITAKSPGGIGSVYVTVTTPGGTSATSSADKFTYIYSPVYPPPTTLPLSINANGTHFNTVISISGKTMADITVNSPDNNVTLNIPSGTTLLTSSGTAPAYPTSIIMLPDTFAPQSPPGDNIIGIPYSCLPGGLHFNPPVTLTWKLDGLPAGVSPADLEVAFYDTTSRTWVAVPSTYDPATGSMVATISHFTDYAVINTAVSTTTTTATTTTPTTAAIVPVTTSTSSTPATTYTPPPVTTSTSSPVITSTSPPATTAVTVPPGTSTTLTTSAPATTSSSAPWGLIIGIIAAVVVILIVLVVVTRKRHE